MSESEIQAQVLNYLDTQRHRIYAWRNQTGQLGRIRFGCPGSADIIAVMAPGLFVGIEVKTPEGKQSPGQKAWAKRVENLGGLYWLVRSVEDVIDYLENHT